MTEGLEHIGKKSVAWSYMAVFFSVGAGVILLPFILHYLNPETVAIWNILQTIYVLIVFLDLGFRPSFARNISYIFSGVTEFQVNGVSHSHGTEIDYNLLKTTIAAMKKFYRYLSIAILILLSFAGTAYFMYLMDKFHGDKTDAMVSWILFCIINCYNLYTLYYDALLTGKGYITRLQQITVIGQIVYISVAVLLLYTGNGLTSVILAQSLSVLIKRVCAYYVFYSKEMKSKLNDAFENNPNKILHIIAPNALKVGATQIGGFIINKSSLFIGSVYLTLNNIAMYGVSTQVIDILARCGTVLYITYTPQLAQCRADNNMKELKKKYIMCVVALVIIYLFGGSTLLFLGNPILRLVGSQTELLPTICLLPFIIISLLEQNHIIAAGFIQADNKIPFFIPSIISGIATVITLWIMLDIMDLGVLGLILAPGLVQLAYQNWKWPSVIINEFRKQ